jgi:hypothetical protein
MSIVTHISPLNCFGSSALFAVVALVATAAAGNGAPRSDEAAQSGMRQEAQQYTVRDVSESCPDMSSVRFDLPALKVAFNDAVCFRSVVKGGAR